MTEQQKHEMILEETYPSGAEEWYCPLCDRRLFVMSWHPDGKQIILQHGDERSHSTMEQKDLGGMDMPGTSDLGSEDHLGSAFWSKWLDEAGFESWWNSPLK
jgi:hypothetical protein